MDTGHTFADAVGNNVVQSQVLELLAEVDEPLRRHEIADELGVSQASISRAATKLIGTGLVEEVGEKHALALDDNAASGINQIKRSLDPR